MPVRAKELSASFGVPQRDGEVLCQRGLNRNRPAPKAATPEQWCRLLRLRENDVTTARPPLRREFDCWRAGEIPRAIVGWATNRKLFV
jgi:hypothetical protein